MSRRVSKDKLVALLQNLGEIDLRVPMGDGSASVNIGALCHMALATLEKETPKRKFRFSNPGEVTTWQKKECWESGLAALGDARLVWVNEADAIEMGEEIKQERKEAQQQEKQQ